MKVVIDTNIFIMSFSSRSVYHDIFQQLRSGTYTLVVTHEILLEYEEIMAEKYGENTAKLFLILLGELPNVEFIRTFFKFSLIEKDPDDNKFIDATFASSAKFLVSEDRHFRILKKINFPKIEVIGIDMFLELLKKV